MNTDPELFARGTGGLPALDWVTDAPRVARSSQTFAWFSPVLKRQLGEKTAQVAVRPRTEAMLLHHTCGTNGIVLELEVALASAPALDWVESIATFASFDAALEFSSALASAPGLVKKEVCFLGTPVPDHMAALAVYRLPVAARC